MTRREALAARVVRPAHAGRGDWAPKPEHHVLRIFNELVGPIGGGCRWGNELAIDYIRVTEATVGSYRDRRIHRQSREED